MKKILTILAVLIVIGLAYVFGYHNGTVDATKRFSKKLNSAKAKSSHDVTSLNKKVVNLHDKLITLSGTIRTQQSQLASARSLEQVSDDKLHVSKFEITAYSPYDDKSGINADSTPNTTATGTKPHQGTFAVDPGVIPYGSQIVIMYNNGQIERGVAEDTGGAINYNHIDVFRSTYNQAMEFGKRSATVVWYRGDRFSGAVKTGG